MEKFEVEKLHQVQKLSPTEIEKATFHAMNQAFVSIRDLIKNNTVKQGSDNRFRFNFCEKLFLEMEKMQEYNGDSHSIMTLNLYRRKIDDLLSFVDQMQFTDDSKKGIFQHYKENMYSTHMGFQLALESLSSKFEELKDDKYYRDGPCIYKLNDSLSKKFDRLSARAGDSCLKLSAKPDDSSLRERCQQHMDQLWQLLDFSKIYGSWQEISDFPYEDKSMQSHWQSFLEKAEEYPQNPNREELEEGVSSIKYCLLDKYSDDDSNLKEYIRTHADVLQKVCKDPTFSSLHKKVEAWQKRLNSFLEVLENNNNGTSMISEELQKLIEEGPNHLSSIEEEVKKINDEFLSYLDNTFPVSDEVLRNLGISMSGTELAKDSNLALSSRQKRFSNLRTLGLITIDDQITQGYDKICSKIRANIQEFVDCAHLFEVFDIYINWQVANTIYKQIQGEDRIRLATLIGNTETNLNNSAIGFDELDKNRENLQEQVDSMSQYVEEIRHIVGRCHDICSRLEQKKIYICWPLNFNSLRNELSNVLSRNEYPHGDGLKKALLYFKTETSSSQKRIKISHTGISLDSQKTSKLRGDLLEGIQLLQKIQKVDSPLAKAEKLIKENNKNFKDIIEKL